jgi:hypothetical protein
MPNFMQYDGQGTSTIGKVSIHPNQPSGVCPIFPMRIDLLRTQAVSVVIQQFIDIFYWDTPTAD